nr:response regulator [Bacteroidota bacterium]
MDETKKILLVEDNPGDVIIFREMISEINNFSFQLDDANRLSLSLEILKSSHYDIIVCDLGLPDSQGLGTFLSLYNEFPEIPIIVLTNNSNIKLGLEAVKSGAQDYLIKDEVTSQLLNRTLAYSIERKQLIERLQDSEMRFRRMFEDSSLGIFQSTAEGRMLKVNKAFATIFGYDSPAEVKEKFIDIANMIYVEPQRRHELVKKLNEGEEDFIKSENKLYRKDGSIIIGSMHIRKVTIPNSDSFLLEGYVEDITDKKNMLEKLEMESSINEGMAKLAEQLLQPDISIVSISKLVMNYAKKFTSSQHGYAGTIEQPGSELLIHTYSEMIKGGCAIDLTGICFEKTGNTYPALWGHSLNTKTAFYTNDPQNHHTSSGLPHGHVQLQNFMSVPALIDGELVGQIALANTKDGFGERKVKQVERLSYLYALAIQKHNFTQELLISKENAQASDRLKSAFLANMSHEIRTPLNAIVGFSEMLSETDLSGEEIDQFKKTIADNSDILLKLISDIIEMAMIEAGEIKIKTEEFVLQDFAYENYKYYSGSEDIFGQGPKVQINFLPDQQLSNAIIKTDSLRLSQVIKSLINNAIRFTREGHVDFGYLATDDNQIEFFISDTGVGIADDQQKYIFERFRQVEELAVRPFSGTGLGLTITKKLVELLGGTIRLESAVGVGTTFRITLPLITHAESKTVITRPGTKKSKLDLDGKKVLVVEDHRSNYELIQVALDRKNAKALWAETGKDALEIFANMPDIDLIIVDLQLPEISGFEVIEIIRETNKTIPIIVITAFSSNEERQKALAAGCNDFLIKPVNKKQLYNSILKFID